MKRKILLLILVAVSTMGYVRAQNAKTTTSPRDSVAYQTTFYFQLGVGDWIQQSDYTKMNRLLNWAKSNTTTPIEITGWADKTGNAERNKKLSLRRAGTIRNYLVRKGISSERISFEGQCIDMKASSNIHARRADVRGVIQLAIVAEPTNKPQSEPTEITPAVTPQPVKQPKQEAIEAEPIQEQSPTQQSVIKVSKAKSPSNSNLSWYITIEGGVSLGVSTLSSFTPNGGIGWNAGILGGYRFSSLLSTEMGISLGELKLGASNCCQDYFLGADGARYLEPVAGMGSYSYKDIYSSVSMQQYSLRLNVDMLQIINPDWNKRWSLALSPAIYGINSTATLKISNATIIKRDSQFQFATGVSIGVSYQITDNLGIGVRSGAAWVFGNRYDGITPTDHKENMIWNNTIMLTWRFGKMKNE